MYRVRIQLLPLPPLESIPERGVQQKERKKEEEGGGEATTTIHTASIRESLDGTIQKLAKKRGGKKEKK